MPDGKVESTFPDIALDVDHPAIRRQHALVHRFGQRRVREDRGDEVFFRRLKVHSDDEALNQFGDLGADQMGAEKLAGFLVENGLREAVRFAERNRLAVADKRELPDTYVVAGCLCLRLGEADGCNLRVAVGAPRSLQLVHGGRLQPGDALDTDNTLVLRLVGVQRRAGNVANGVDAGHAGAAETVCDDAAAVGLHAELLQAEVLDVAQYADGRDDAVELDVFLLAVLELDRRGDAVGRLGELRHLRLGVNLDAGFLQALADVRRDLFVLDG